MKAQKEEDTLGECRGDAGVIGATAGNRDFQTDNEGMPPKPLVYSSRHEREEDRIVGPKGQTGLEAPQTRTR